MLLPPSQTIGRGVTLTELVVVLLIISLLSTIALPVYITKAQQAKIAVAKQEARHLAQAEEQVVIIHGFYVPLQVLDDIIFDRNIHRTSGPRTDDLENENKSQIFLIDPFIDVFDQQFGQLTLQNSVSDIDARVESLFDFWAGPFISSQRQRVAFGDAIRKDPSLGNSQFTQWDFPLDPWGNPYRFYSPIGLIGSDATRTDVGLGQVLGNFGSFSDGRLTTRDDRFDRYAIVSVGPDGTSPGIQGGGGVSDRDDIIYEFSGFFNESSFGAFF